MKKYLFVLVILIMCTLSACADKEELDAKTENYGYITEAMEDALRSYSYAAPAYGETDEETNKDKDVRITLKIPVEYVPEGRSGMDYDELAEGLDIEKIVPNDDGSVSYAMTKDQYNYWMEQLRILLSSEINYGFYDNLTYAEPNEDFSVIELYSNNLEINTAEGYTIYDIIKSAEKYQVFSQKPVQDIQINLGYQDPEDVEETNKKNQEIAEEMYEASWSDPDFNEDDYEFLEVPTTPICTIHSSELNK